jgi:hypothetical protein
LLTVGVPLVTVGVIAAMVDEESSTEAPTYREWRPWGVAAIISGGVMTAVGTMLYLRHPVDTPNPHPVLKWSGVALLTGALATGALALKYHHDYRNALDEYTPICHLDCKDPRLEPIRNRRDYADRRVPIFTITSGLLAVGGVFLFLASREGGDQGSPQIQVTGTGASVGWSATF